MTGNEVTAAILVALGCLLLFWRSRRRFSRLNGFGIEQFPNHWRMLTSTGFDFALFSVGTTLIAIAALILLFGEHEVILAIFVAGLAVSQFKSN